jgi:glycosyltransferase involved in cell wall biosynthesis
VITPHKHRFLFVCLLILGKDTAYRNLRDAIDHMEDIDASWLPIELEPKEFFCRIPPVSMNHSLKYGFVARSRVHALEKSGKMFDAAFFNHILPTLFLRGFRKRVPSIDAMDVTPLSLLRDGQPYYERPRNQGMKPLLEFKRKFAQSVFRGAAYVLPQSNYTRESLIHDYCLSEEKIKVLAPGVNLAMWHGRSSDGLSQKRIENSMNILFVGGDFLRKGGDLLLKIAERKEFRECRFHFVTRKFVGECPANVILHSEVHANSDVLRELYEHADVFVLPTRSDFAPTNSICEAMAMGLPVISTGVGGLDEIIVDGETGFLIPVDDEEVLAQRLISLMNNKDMRGRMGRNARTLAESRFNIVNNARVLVEYMKLASSQNDKQELNMF